MRQKLRKKQLAMHPGAITGDQRMLLRLSSHHDRFIPEVVLRKGQENAC